MPRQKAATRQKRITRGPRKGQTITVYAKSGTEVKSVRGTYQGSGINRTRNKRSGMAYTKIRKANGKIAHAYANGKVVTLKPKKRAAKKKRATRRRRK
jgi:hypothetical protein